ncbi:polysaccharide deacetylase family protein [Caulobacter sp. KR2-114]|uniref:polysaccharide deacetylase family protein n=1 Tax=Caulobacter sp. KR2-114 TaxID=3400912 RepID=UPI003C0E073F
MTCPRRLLSPLAMALALIVAAAGPARAGQVALTFDDLPGLSLVDDQAYADDFNSRLLHTLRRRHIPAVGFVIGQELGEPAEPRLIARVNAWLAAGMALGNHTFSHESPETLGTLGYVADLAQGDAAIRPLLAARGQVPRWFRHPYLETGATAARKRAVDGWLARHGYRVAPVTIDASDWEFAEPYDDALAHGDAARARRIQAQYLAYTAQRIAWARKASRALFGRQIAHVMLLHDTRLNADCLDRVLGLLRQAGLKPVTLQQALLDPAYRTADRHVGSDGPDWLDRWAETLHKPLPEGDDDPPANIQAEYDKVDSDRR